MRRVLVVESISLAVEQNPMKHMGLISKHIGLIPARLSSKRLKNKPLQLINGRPMCLHVAESLIKTKVFDQVVVATDSKEVMDIFKEHKAQAVMTDPNHPSGTDRIHEVVIKLGLNDGVVFNVQGDEPFIYKDDLLSLKKVMEEGAKMASLYEPLTGDDVEDLNKVKVLINKKNEAIYFSRFGIPFSRCRPGQNGKALDEGFVGKHIGLYAYHVKFLQDFCNYGEGYFEFFEKLEQLRALEMGAAIKMILTKNSYQSVDTLEDLKKANELISQKARKVAEHDGE